MDISTIRFGVGSHDATTSPTGDRDMCIMEAVAYMAGEPWSNAPACASPVIASFMRAWNDALSDDDRDRLLPAAVWVPRLVGSRGDTATEMRRSYLALDWLVRIYTPAWLDLVPSLATHAAALRALPEVLNMPCAQDAGSIIHAAREAARTAAREAAQAAAREAARAAARDARAAAWDAACDAARAAAWDAAWDAWDAARDAGDGAGDAARTAARTAALEAALEAAWDAARTAARTAALEAALEAAWDAARTAAREAAQGAATGFLRSTVDVLQQSALDLLDRMLACGEHRREEER